MTVNKIETCATNSELIYVGPNPTSGNLNIGVQLPASSSVSLRMVNSIGQTMYQRSFIQITTLEQQQVQMQNFAKGVYYLSLYSGNKKVKTLQVVKQ